MEKKLSGFSSIFDKKMWINENEKETESNEKVLKMPSETPIISQTAITFSDSNPFQGTKTDCSMYMDQVLKMYEQGFESLNKPGIDFFEYFQSVTNAGSDNSLAYSMALNMLKTIDKSVDKDSLLSHSQFYVDEISKVHNNYKRTGEDKIQQVTTEMEVEEKDLKTSIQILLQQMESIKQQVSMKESELSSIHGKYYPKIEEIKCKLEANNQAREKILGSILKVIEGIKTNL